MFEHLSGAAYDGSRHAGQPRHVYAEGMLRSAALERAQKNHPAVFFDYRHIPVLDARKERFHFIELVVVGGEERAGVGGGVFVYVLHDGPGYGDAVVGRCAASQLVEQHEAAWREVVHDVGGFAHLYHEGALAY